MSILRNLSTKLRAPAEAIQQMSDSVLRAAGRIFSPSDDNYPATGAQPFEGDIPDARHRDLQ